MTTADVQMLDGDEVEFTPAELEYLKSGGSTEKQPEVEIEPARDLSPPAPAAQQPPPPPPPPAAQADPDAPDKDGRVPHQALHRERELRKQTQAENSQYRDAIAKVEARLDVLNKVLFENPEQKKQQTEEEAEPDPEKDIFAHNRWLKNQLSKVNEKLDQKSTATEARVTHNEMAAAYNADVDRFRKLNPDMDAAAGLIVQQRMEELKAWGYTPDQIRQTIANDEVAFYTNAFRQGLSPAEVIYKTAEARGYKRAQQVADQQATGGAANGTNQIDQQKLQEDKAKFDNLKNAQAASASLSGTGGDAGEGLTMAQLVDMDEDQFGAVVAKMTAAQRRQYYGT